MSVGPVEMVILTVFFGGVILMLVHFVRSFQRDSREEKLGFMEEIKGGNNFFIDLEEPIKVGRAGWIEPVEGNIVNYAYTVPSSVMSSSVKRVYHIDQRLLLRDVQVHHEIGGFVDVLLPRTPRGERWLGTMFSDISNKLMVELSASNELIDELERDLRTSKIGKAALTKIHQYRAEGEMMQRRVGPKKGEEGPKIELPGKNKPDEREVE